MGCSVPRFAAVEDAQHHQAIAIDPILEDVGRVEYLQDELAILHAPGNRTPQPRESRQHLCLGGNLLGHSGGEIGILLVRERRKAVEIGERVLRPLDAY